MRTNLATLLVVAALALPFFALADNPVTPSYTIVVTEAETECVMLADSRLKLYDMQCNQAPVRCGISAADGVDASDAIICISNVLATYPVDPAKRNQWLCIHGDAAGTTTCRVYESRTP